MSTPVMVTTLAALKISLGIAEGDKSEDSLLLNLIKRCDQVTKTWLKVANWELTTQYTEFLNGNNDPIVILRQKPVLSIVNVWEDPNACAGQGPNDFGPDTLLVAGEDYYLPPNMPDGSNTSWTGQLVRLNGVWAGQWVYYRGLLTPTLRKSTGTIKVIYNAGWASGVPADVTLAAENMIAAFRMGSQYGKSLSTLSYKGFSANFQPSADGFFSEQLKDLLPTYRRLLR